MPTNNGFTVTTEKLDEAVKIIEEKTSRFDADIKKLYSEAESLTSSAWKGTASQAFLTRVKSYQGDFDQFKASLKQYGEKITQKSINYRNTEEELTSSAGNI